MIIHTWSTHILIHTPAKLNLYLEILGKRPDQFHEIETLMATVGIYDSLLASRTEDGEIRLTCRIAAGQGPQSSPPAQGDLPSPENNLVVRAARALREAANISPGIQFHLLKRIPWQAGLGGASSDAAAALIAANHLWKLKRSNQELAEIAATLGSDIPFFLTTTRSGASWCRGRGEKIQPAENVAPFHCVVVKPPQGLSTAEVYRYCRPPASPRDAGEVASSWSRPNSGILFNRLESPARELEPRLDALHQEFSRAHCWGHQMTGSGSAWFGLCGAAAQARQAAGRLAARGLGDVFCAASCSSGAPAILS